MTPPSRHARGPLSWQQAFRLRWEGRLGVRSGNVRVVFSLPEDASLDRLRRRVEDEIEHEEALRITGVTTDGGGVTYADQLAVPMSVVSVDSVEQRDALGRELGAHRFSRHGQVMWKLAVVGHPDNAGKGARTVYAVFDHLVADGRSGQIFQRDVLGDRDEARFGRRGRYRDWVTWQHERYPLEDASRVPTPARDFWRRYLDGIAPNRTSIMSFCTPTSSPTGVELLLYRDLPVSGEALRAGASRLRTTPFLLFVGSAASAVAAFSKEEDITFKYTAHGRFRPFLETLGWLASGLPIRIRGRALVDPHQAIRAATASRLELFGFETTPWGYILEVCGAAPPETPQVLLNFIPIDGAWSLARPADRVIEGDLSPDLNLRAFVPRTGTGLLECQFDRERFAPDGVESFLGALFANMVELAR